MSADALAVAIMVAAAIALAVLAIGLVGAVLDANGLDAERPHEEHR